MGRQKKVIHDFERNWEQYLKHFDLLKKNEPEKFELIEEIAVEITDIELSIFIENVALSIDKNKKSYSEITTTAGKRIFIKEQIELYTYANHRFERYGDYANETFDKYQPLFIEALEYWRIESATLNTLPLSRTKKNEHPHSFVYTDNNKFEKFEYCKIGALFAQGFIKKNGTNYYFKDEEFNTATELHERVSMEILDVFGGKKIKPSSIKPYISDTLSGTDSKKNFNKNRTIHDNVIKFCTSRNLNVTEEFRHVIKD